LNAKAPVKNAKAFVKNAKAFVKNAKASVKNVLSIALNAKASVKNVLSIALNAKASVKNVLSIALNKLSIPLKKIITMEMQLRENGFVKIENERKQGRMNEKINIPNILDELNKSITLDWSF
jgi:hypothetical protein